MIHIRNLSKTYKNGYRALNKISLDIDKGEFVGLLGPNGAGKTTLINILAGNTRKTEGKVFINNINIDDNEIGTKKIMGVVPQELSYDSFFTVGEVLQMQSGYFGIRNNEEHIGVLLKALGLTDKKDANTKTLSGGMKRRLMIAKALVHKPKFFILDEPTAGVDIELRQQMYKYIRNLHKLGTTILLTTHYLEEAEMLCDRIIIINEGDIIADDRTETLKKILGYDTTLEFTFKKKVRPEDFEYLKAFQPTFNEFKITLTANNKECSNIFQEFVKHHAEYESFHMKDTNLEDVFLKLTYKKT